ncbi:hypothetical protein FOZ62_009296, partial [Perkinsus olseni]
FYASWRKSVIHHHHHHHQQQEQQQLWLWLLFILGFYIRPFMDYSPRWRIFSSVVMRSRKIRRA